MITEKMLDIDVWNDGKLIPVSNRVRKQMLFSNIWAKADSHGNIWAFSRRYTRILLAGEIAPLILLRTRMKMSIR